MRREFVNNKRYSIYDDMAFNDKKNNLPSGRCQKCGNNDDALYPTLIDLCKRCTGTFMKNKEGIKVIQRKVLFTRPKCDWCYERTGVLFQVNIYVCGKCLAALGRREAFHKKFR